MRLPFFATAPRPQGNNDRGGFTLLELLLSIGLLTMLSTLLFLILDSASRLWRENERRVDSYREARVALNLIARELDNLFFLDPTLARSLIVNPENSDGVTLPTSTANSTRADSLCFTTLMPQAIQHSGKNRSDLCAVAYYLAWTPSSGSVGSTSSYKLHRYFKSSDDVFDALTPPSSSLYSNIKSQVDNNNDVLARNITSFKVRAYQVNSSGNLEPVTPAQLGPPQNVRPTLLELEIRAINAETAAKLTERTDWENASNPLRVAAEQVFTTRIYLPAATP